MAEHAAGHAAAQRGADNHNAMHQPTGVPDEAQQPLLSDTDHESHQDRMHHPSLEASRKDSRDDWHWLEKLVFKTRVHFAISVTLFFVFWTLVALVVTGDWPGSDIRWPWSRRPANTHYGSDFYAAQFRLSDQPFCLPRVGLLQPADVQREHPDGTGTSSPYPSPFYNRTDAASAGARYHSTSSSSDDTAWLGLLGQNFDAIAGTTVRESAKRRRDTVDLVVSIAQGAPFYTRKAEVCSRDSSGASDDHINTQGTFRSRKLWQVVEQLAWTASQEARTIITPEEMLRALHLNRTRIVEEPPRGRSSSSNATIALQTTLMDTQKLVQTLVAVFHGLEQPAESFLNDAVVQRFFALYQLSTDGSTGSTRSPFNFVRKDLSRRSRALSAVGDKNYRGYMRLQHGSRPIDLYVLHDMHGDHELDMTVDLERGLIVTTLAHLSRDLTDSAKGVDCRPPLGSQTNSPWDWLTQNFDNLLYGMTWRLEERTEHAWAGTYRYEAGAVSDSAAAPASATFDWVEVDVQMDERVPWITRIEYAQPRLRRSSTNQAAFSTDQALSAEFNSTVSVLRKYNVGGTADFLAGWTCQWCEDALAACYRPRMGSDDGKCTCKDWRSDEASSYRVGLWPVREEGQKETDVYHIPRGAIRLDGNSYMDQGIGGCSALFDSDEQQHVPEMEAFGYTLRFTQDVLEHDGTVDTEVKLEWLEKGLKMKRVRQPRRKW